MLSLAARLRPRRLQDVIGQVLVRKVLQNGLDKGKLSSSCLFTGPAGTGKTTLARVTATWLVCSNKEPIENKQAGEDEKMQPCLKCENCQAMQKGNHPDVFEFDAASNTGVDDIKECLEGANYKTQMSTNKIYIIDEVHMLSKSAISALLKIIEEPADNLWFLLATTELDKMPYTIISRCLTMQIQPISDHDMKLYLAKVCKDEGYDFEDGVLEIITHASLGCLRAALSYLEQGMILGELTLDNMRAIVRMLSNEELNDIYNTLQDKQKLYDLLKAALYVANPYLLTFQLLQVAEKKGDTQLALQLGYALEELAYSPAPDKILFALIAKAAYINSLPSAQMIWSKLKEEVPVKMEEVGKEDLLKKAKQLFK